MTLWFSEMQLHMPVFKKLQNNESKVENNSPSKEGRKPCCCQNAILLMSFISFTQALNSVQCVKSPRILLGECALFDGALISGPIVPMFFNGLESEPTCILGS